MSNQRLLGNVNRFERCVPSCTHPPERPEMAQVQGERPDIHVSMSSIRSFHSPTGLYSYSKDSGGLSQTKGRQSVRVPRRLADIQSVAGRGSAPYKNGSRDRDEFGFCDKCEEIKLRPDTDPQFLGARLHLSEGLARPSPERSMNIIQCVKILSAESHAPATAWLRVLGLMASLVDLVPNCRMHMRPIQLHLLAFYRPSCHSVYRMVPMSELIRDKLKWWSTTANLNIGVRFPAPLPQLTITTDASKMGWGSYSGSDGFGPVVPNGSQVSHQLVRTLGGRKNDPGVRRSVDGLQVHSAVGQFDGGSIHQQTRRYKISPVVHAHSSLVEEVSPSRNVTQGYPHSRGHKHSSGRPLSRSRCGPDRMGTVSSGGPNHLPSNVLSDSGSVCISKQPPTTSILLQDARSKSTGGRRTTLELERNDGLRISSNFAATESNTENSQRRLQHNTHSTLLAKASMVSAHGEPSHRYTSVSSTVTRPPETAGSGDSGADHSAGSSEVNCMAVIRQRCEESGFSQKAANLIAHGRKDSTLGIYSGRLGRYYKWCEKTNCSPARATQSQIADFLTEVFDSGLQVATVSNYKSAIAAIHRGFEDGSTLYKNDYIRLLLNGMYNSRPPKRRIVPAWNLSKVLELLKGAPYEPMKSATLREITLKTVFLVALATGRRRSELQALSFKTLVFSRNGVSMTFKVGFIAKMNARRFNTGPSCFRGLALSHPYEKIDYGALCGLSNTIFIGPVILGDRLTNFLSPMLNLTRQLRNRH
ncbi:uncharacterized protein [Amphiura filiformis]|uniref:uncharacterized protein n=1 Tax=Amphiura filiformis TaxID=82378 RepID=UPI003B21F4FC